MSCTDSPTTFTLAVFAAASLCIVLYGITLIASQLRCLTDVINALIAVVTKRERARRKRA